MTVVYVGLGSNLQDPISQLMTAQRHLMQQEGVKLVRMSALYLTKPWGYVDQPDFVNAVAQLETECTPRQVWSILESIEKQQGRVRQQRWGPRTLDLDILLYGQNRYDDERLTIPHPRMWDREFVRRPLCEIAKIS